MKNWIHLAFIILLLSQKTTSQNSDFIIAFGSCNKQTVENKLWKEIIKNRPNLWIWGGDNIYSDTEDMSKMKNDYNVVLKDPNYQKLMNGTEIMGTWDDHDYGLNDGGVEFVMKKESQNLFLNFLHVSKNNPRREQEGIYTSKSFTTRKGSIKVIVLDTRYFRSPLKKSATKGKRYDPDTNRKKTMLGKQQWKWLSKELKSAKEDFVIIVSSIQVLSSEHGFEKWGNLPRELEKLKKMIAKSNKNVIVLSGDRHISEFSIDSNKRFKNPFVDFTSSGLTHAYKSFSGEPNKYRKGKVVHTESFGLLRFDLTNKKVIFEMRGKDNILQQQYIQEYK